MRAIVAMRRQDKHKREEFEAILNLYMDALGMLGDTPLGRAMTGRRRLPNRRAGETRAMMFRDREYRLTVGRFDDGGLAEIFIDAEKASTDSADDARDAALCLSLALQFGVPSETIRQAVTRASNGAPAGVIGAVLDALAVDETREPHRDA
ncbi:Ribonucleotide-diphosphate reductase alpha subunit [Methylocystis sp. SC2]|nr:Ribonucleotide-diphosphate reductase alpha subunit [Methylocystis sp. SC2]